MAYILQTWMSTETIFPILIKLYVVCKNPDQSLEMARFHLRRALKLFVPSRFFFLEVVRSRKNVPKDESASYDYHLTSMEITRKFVAYDVFGRRIVSESRSLFSL